MVGLTRGFFELMFKPLAYACEEPGFVHHLNAQAPADQSRAELFTMLYLTSLQFVTAHELGHHVHGHCEPSRNSSCCRRKEIVPAAAATDNLESQAAEIDADGYSVFMTLANLMKDGPRRTAAKLLGKADAPAECGPAILAAFLTSVSCFFHISQGPFDAKRISVRTHPFELARLYFVVRHLRDWSAKYIPELAAWPDSKDFWIVQDNVRAALSTVIGDQNWSEQQQFLASEPGKEYMHRLEATIPLVRSSMEPYKWEVLAEARESGASK